MLGKMANRKFTLSDLDLEARLRRLDRPQADALESILEHLSRNPDERDSGKAVRAAGAVDAAGISDAIDTPLSFLLPMVEAGFSAPQILTLMEKVPFGFPKDHRLIYFDFRLARWIRHIEPPTFREIMEEYLEHAPTREEGLAYLEKEWAEFLRRQARP
ncbi:MAG: hypothetical protein ABI036_19595 [Fibrobacteria bacterium]